MGVQVVPLIIPSRINAQRQTSWGSTHGCVDDIAIRDLTSMTCGVAFQEDGVLGRDGVHLMKTEKCDFAYTFAILVWSVLNKAH